MISSFQEYLQKRITCTSQKRLRSPRQKNQLFYLRGYETSSNFHQNKLRNLFFPQSILEAPKLELTELVHFQKQSKRLNKIRLKRKIVKRDHFCEDMNKSQEMNTSNIKIFNPRKFRQLGDHEKNKILKALEINKNQIYKEFLHEQYSSINFNLYKQFIEIVKCSLCTPHDIVNTVLKLKLKRHRFHILMQVTMKGLQSSLNSNESKYLTKHLQQICQKIFKNQIIQQIGGIFRMRQLFELLYTQFQNDEFLSHLLIDYSVQKINLEKYFYYFLKDDLVLLQEELTKNQVKISTHEYYLIKERLWQLMRSQISTKIITRLLENLQIIFKFMNYNTALPVRYHKLKNNENEPIILQQIFMIKYRWQEGIQINPFLEMQNRQNIKLSEIMIQVQKYLCDSDFLKHYPEEGENLIYQSEQYSGLQLFQYIIMCIFSENHCIQSTEIREILSNDKISEYVPGLWLHGLKYCHEQFCKKHRKNLEYFESWMKQLMNIFEKLGLNVQFKKQ